MKKAIAYAHELDPSAFDTMEQFKAGISKAMRDKGVPHSPAQYDETGRCLTCGQSALCPGVHTFEEIQEASRLQFAEARGKMVGMTGAPA